MANSKIRDTAMALAGLAMAAATVVTGWIWVQDRFLTKQEGTEMYLEVKIQIEESSLRDIEQRLQNGDTLELWEQRRYDQLKTSVDRMVQKRNELMGL